VCAGVDDTKVGSAVGVDCFEDSEGIKVKSEGFGKPCSFNSFLRSGPLADVFGHELNCTCTHLSL